MRCLRHTAASQLLCDSAHKSAAVNCPSLPHSLLNDCCSDGEESVQDVWASELPSSSSSTSGRSIVAADVRDPYVLLHLSDGSAALLAADATSCGLAPVEAPVLQPGAGQGQVTACCLYSDSCGWLRRHVPLDDGSGSGGMYCGVCRAGGSFQLYSLPAWRPVFACDSLAQGPAVLTSSATGGRAAPAAGSEEAAVVEVRLAAFGPVAAGRSDPAAARASKATACEAPVLLALTADHQLLAYRAFAPGSASSSASGGSASLRRGLAFRRLPLDVPPLLPPVAGEQQPQGAAAQQAPRLQRLHCFEGLGEEAPYSGLFVAGAGMRFGFVLGSFGRLCWVMLIASRCIHTRLAACMRALVGFLPLACISNSSTVHCCRAAPALAGGQPRRPGGAPPLPAATSRLSAGGPSARMWCSWVHPFPQRQLPPRLHRGNQ